MMNFIIKNLKSLSKYFLLIVVGVFIFHLPIIAAQTGFNIEIEYPDNQVNRQVTYFDLAIKPRLEQTLHVKLTSYDDKKVVSVKLQVTNAYTTALGEVAYLPSPLRAESLHVALSDVLIPESTLIQLQPQETRDVRFHLKVPASIPQGIILGSIYATPAPNTDGANGSSGLDNSYAIVKGVQLNYGKVPPPEVAIQKLTTGIFNHKPTFLLTLENMKAGFLKDNCQVMGEIIHQESGKKINFQSLIFSMAPQSQVDLPLNSNVNTIDPGHYVANIKLKVENKTITKKLETAVFQTMERQDTPRPLDFGDSPQWVILLLFILAFTLIGCFIYIFDQRGKKLK